MPKNIVQMNNQYIQDEHQRRKYHDEERKKRNRFMGWVLILIILLFILPTYNLAQSYQTLQERKQQYVQLQEKYQQTIEEKVVKTVQQFLEYSDTKLEELAKKNQALKLQEETQERSKDE